VLQSLDELLDGVWLVAGWLEVRDDFELRHPTQCSAAWVMAPPL
jgi:hypothetical protein